MRVERSCVNTVNAPVVSVAGARYWKNVFIPAVRNGARPVTRAGGSLPLRLPVPTEIPKPRLPRSFSASVLNGRMNRRPSKSLA